MIKRPVLIITISYIIGIIGGIYIKKYIFLFYILILIAISIYHIYIKNHKNSNHSMLYDRQYLIIAYLGIVVTFFSSVTIIQKEKSFDSYYSNNESINMSGTIVGMKNETEYNYNYIVKVKSNNKRNNSKIYIQIPKKECKYNFSYGDYVQFKGIFSKASGRRNYKGFDYFFTLKSKNIYGTCVVDDIMLIKESGYSLGKMRDNAREKIKINLKKHLDKETYNIALALFLGDNTNVTDEQTEIFSNANLSHILAISGMHVSYVIIAVRVLFRRFGKRRENYCIILMLIMYCFFIGGSPSVIRATIMGCLLITSNLVYRKSDTINNIAISALIILISNPYQIFNLGFELSFLGTLGIVLFEGSIKSKLIVLCSKLPKNKIVTYILDAVSASISANIMIMPIIIYKFNTISVVFFISNIIVSPLLGILVFTGFIVCFISLFSCEFLSFFYFTCDLLLKVFYFISLFSSNLTALRTKVITPNVITIILMYVIIFYFYSKANIRTRIILKRIKEIIVILAVVLLIVKISAVFNANMKIFFIDVGQGDCCLIVTASNKKILIDGGGSESKTYDVGKQTLVPYLLDRQINKIDYIIVSHFDSDHVLGLLTVMDELKVKNAVISAQGKNCYNYENFKEIAKRKGIRVIIVGKGDRLNIDNTTYIDFLWPNNKELINENILNNNSILLKVCFNKFSILFTGDIEKIAEEQILKEYDSKINVLKSDMIKVAHHGSSTSSTQEFIDAVKPKIALIGVGEKNKFGHPNAEVINRLIDGGTKIFRTDEMGEIILEVNPKGKIKIKKQHK